MGFDFEIHYKPQIRGCGLGAGGFGLWSGAVISLTERGIFIRICWKLFVELLCRRQKISGFGLRMETGTSRWNLVIIFCQDWLLLIRCCWVWIVLFSKIRGSSAPSKMCVFSWQTILDRIPTRMNLFRRGVIQPAESKDCVVCRNEADTSLLHLLLHCNFASGVWYAIFNWLGVSYISPPNLRISFAYMVGTGVSNRRKKGLMLLWQVVYGRFGGLEMTDC